MAAAGTCHRGDGYTIEAGARDGHVLAPACRPPRQQDVKNNYSQKGARAKAISMEAIILDREGQCAVPLAGLYGNSINVMGLKRSGKTNTGFVFMEGWLNAGHAMTFVDPHNEGWGLKIDAAGQRPSPYQIIVAGRGKRADVPLNVEHAPDLAEFSYTRRISVVLSLFRIGEEERFAVLRAYFERLWSLAEQAYDDEHVFNYGIALEEAPTYLPQEGATPVKPILKRIVQEGGKFGFTTFLITQRSQDIDKRILGQGALYVLHSVIHPRDKEVYLGIVPEPRERVEKRIAGLGQGDAIVVYEKTVRELRMRAQETYHVGVTPGVAHRDILPIPALDAATLEQLRAMMTRDLPQDPARERLARLERRIEELEEAARQSVRAHEEAIASKEAEIAALRSQLELLGALRLTIEGSSSAAGEPALTAPLHLASLSAEVAQATIDVRQLLGAASEQGDGREGGAPLILTAKALLLRIQRLEEEKAQIQTELALVRGEALAQQGSEPSPGEPEPLLLFSEEKLLKRLVGQAEALSRSEKVLLTWLLEHDGQEVSSTQLADGVGMDVRVTWSAQTRKLVKFPFVARWGANKFSYQALWAEYARKNFASGPGAQDLARRRLIEAAQS
jgi:hypothetical protein